MPETKDSRGFYTVVLYDDVENETYDVVVHSASAHGAMRLAAVNSPELMILFAFEGMVDVTYPSDETHCAARGRDLLDWEEDGTNAEESNGTAR